MQHKTFSRWRWLIPIFLLPLLFCSRLVAQEPEIITMTIHPSPAPVPALKYRLTIDPRLMNSGNAAVHYGKIRAQKNAYFSQPNLDNQLSELTRASLEEVRDSGIAKGLGEHPNLTYYIHLAALCRNCDWQLPIGVEPLYEILLPEIQESRGYARLSAVAARYQIATGQYDKAVVSLQDLLAYARHVSAPPVFAVNFFVSSFLNRMALDQVEFWVQQPDSPNLYWALSTLPRPLMDDFAVQDLARHAMDLSFDFIADIESESRSTDYWNSVLEQLMQFRLADQRSEAINKLKILRAYPKAKTFLKEHGYPINRIQEMPVAQAILLAAYRQEQILQDQIDRWQFLPEAEIDADQMRLDSLAARRSSDRIVPELFSGTYYFGNTSTRHIRVSKERRIAALRIIEAIRLHGSLPEKLSDITEVPIPVDPGTNQPFGYELKGGTARLTQALVPDLYGREIIYEITMAPGSEASK